MYTLYYSPGAASMLIHLALLEAGAAHELKLVDTSAGQQRSPEYLKLNPNGLVPTLLVDGNPYFEAAAGLASRPSMAVKKGGPGGPPALTLRGQ